MLFGKGHKPIYRTYHSIHGLKVIFLLDSLNNSQKTTAISKISRIFVAN